MRLWLSVVAICEAIQALPKYGKKRVQVVILRNSLSLVATANVKESGRATAFNEAKQYITQASCSIKSALEFPLALYLKEKLVMPCVVTPYVED